MSPPQAGDGRPWWQRLFGAAASAVAPARSAVDDDTPEIEAEGPAAVQAEQQLQDGLLVLALFPALDPDLPADALLQAAVSKQLRQRDWSARSLPRRPQLLSQLIQTLNDPEASARVTSGIIGQDAVLTGNLLRIANSPAYRSQERPLDSLQRAVAVVGTDGIRQIISAVLVQPVIQIDSPAFPRFSEIIWEHALLCARAAADHARSVSREDAFAAQWLGLTQGLGAALVMKQVLAEARDSGVPLRHATVQGLLDQWTLPVAQRVAAAWELPAPVHEALVLRPSSSSEAQGLARSLRFARAAASASLLCRHGQMGQSQALALLECLPGTPPHARNWIWRRLHGRSVETLADEEGADGQ